MNLGHPLFISLYFIIFIRFARCVCLCVCLDTDSVQPSTTVDETDECAFAWHGRISFWLCTYFINVLIIKMYPRNIADSRQSRACICVYRCIFSSWNSATRVRCKLVRCKFAGEHTRPISCSEGANNGFFLFCTLPTTKTDCGCVNSIHSLTLVFFFFLLRFPQTLSPQITITWKIIRKKISFIYVHLHWMRFQLDFMHHIGVLWIPNCRI